MLKRAPCHEDMMGEWRYSSQHKVQVVYFMLQLFYPQGKSPQYSLERRLGRPHGQSGCSSEEKKIPSLPLSGIDPNRPAHSLISIQYRIISFFLILL
jgi:hypothetical protein